MPILRFFATLHRRGGWNLAGRKATKNQILHGSVAYNWSYGHYCDFWPTLTNIWLPWQRPLDPCNQKLYLAIKSVFFGMVAYHENPVISNCILVVSPKNAFICTLAILAPKLVAMVTPLCPLCTGVSQMNSAMTQTPSQNQTLHGCGVYNWSYGHFSDFFGLFRPKFGCHGNVPSTLEIRNVFPGLVDHENPLLYVIAFSLSLIEIHLYAFIAILVPKLVVMATPLCPLCTGVSQMNSPMAQTLSQNQTLHGCVAYSRSYGDFCDFLAYFGQHLVAMATSLRPLQSGMVNP